MFNRSAALFFLLIASAVAQGPIDARPSAAPHYPALVRAEVPLYPPAAWAAHFGGTVEVEVTVENGAVIDAQVKHAAIQFEGAAEGGKASESQDKLLPYLVLPSLANVKTWRFEAEGRATFVVTYRYKIEGAQTALPENPRIELDLPRFVRITVRPFKPFST